MRLISRLGTLITLVALFPQTQAQANPYLVINAPGQNSQWVNNNTHYVSWTTGASNNELFDVELARLSTDGLLYVARYVPSVASMLPIELIDVLPADDYFLVFLNVTHGMIRAVSSRFSILPATQDTSNSSTTPKFAKSSKLLATVTVTGGPNPTSSFAYTFAPSSSVCRQFHTGLGTVALFAGIAVLWPWL